MSWSARLAGSLAASRLHSARTISANNDSHHHEPLKALDGGFKIETPRDRAFATSPHAATKKWAKMSVGGTSATLKRLGLMSAFGFPSDVSANMLNSSEDAHLKSMSIFATDEHLQDRW
jgi:hypothetical protein